MNRILYNELNKVTATKIDFKRNDTQIFIPRSIKILNSSLKLGGIYRIRLKSFVINPSSNSTLASNWNKGIVPKYSEYLVEIIDNIGNMIKINGVAINDNSSQFIGWLPIDGFETISKE